MRLAGLSHFVSSSPTWLTNTTSLCCKLETRYWRAGEELSRGRGKTQSVTAPHNLSLHDLSPSVATSSLSSENATSSLVSEVTCTPCPPEQLPCKN